jgi:hypothetical protein
MALADVYANGLIRNQSCKPPALPQDMPTPGRLIFGLTGRIAHGQVQIEMLAGALGSLWMAYVTS